MAKQSLRGLTSPICVFQNWFAFPAGRTGFVYGVSFTSKSELRVDLYIDTADKERNKACSDALVAECGGIEAEVGADLFRERLDDRQALRVAAYRTRVDHQPS